EERVGQGPTGRLTASEFSGATRPVRPAEPECPDARREGVARAHAGGVRCNEGLDGAPQLTAVERFVCVPLMFNVAHEESRIELDAALRKPRGVFAAAPVTMGHCV